MRLWRGLGTRIVLSSVLCGLLGLLVAWLLIRHTTRETMQVGFAPYIHRTFDSDGLRTCENAPETWAIELGRGGRLDAYDISTLRSRNPQSPALDEALYSKLRSGEATPVQLPHIGSDHGGAMVIRAANEGPCSLIQATWPPRSSPKRRFLYLLLAGVVIVIAMAAGLGVVAVVGPPDDAKDRRWGRCRARRLDGPKLRLSGRRESDELGELSDI